jgi:hypothetical protein
MTDRKLCKLAAATALVFGLAGPESTLAQPVNSLPDGPVACAAFQRAGNGSWMVLRRTMLHPNGVPLSLAPGQTFAPNQTLDGFEVTAILDRNCGNIRRGWQRCAGSRLPPNQQVRRGATAKKATTAASSALMPSISVPVRGGSFLPERRARFR